MPKLTSQDRESYKRLYDAAQDLFSILPELPTNISDLFTLQELTKAFSKNFPDSTQLSSFEELQAKVELTGGYLTMYQLFAEVIGKSDVDLEVKNHIYQAIQELQSHYNQLKMSLEAKASQEVDDDDFLDNVTISCSDPLFLGFLKDEQGKEVKTWTQQLMNDRAPALTDSEVQQLIDAWGTAVAKFVEDARNENKGQVNPGRTETIAHFFCIHDQLEGLYSELSTAVAVNS